MEIETLGQAYAHSVRVTMYCAFGPHTKGMQRGRECRYNLDLDMPTLIATRGLDFPLARLAIRLRCPRCGSRDVRVAFSYPSNAGAAQMKAAGFG
ncbi:MAG: hypothetical protein LCH86_07800 [Proteobacteria bacterium]|nr:hypothetical protein [Pseudomonadota bacterium]